MPGYPCCCSECVEGEEPTAGFSYEQTDDDPCTIDLLDESTVHANCEGEIVEWKWYLNEETTPFSTSQNPTGVEVTDGDDIRLWVKDSCGCTDEVVMEIVCEDWTPVTCGSINFTLPPTMTAVFPSVTDPGGCTQCATRGGSRVLDLGLPSSSTVLCHEPSGCCQFTWSAFDPPDPTAAWSLDIFIPIDGTSDLLVIAKLTTSCGVSDWRANVPWQSDFTTFSASLPYSFSTGTACGGVTSTNVSVSS